jgi:hypothetical protein
MVISSGEMSGTPSRTLSVSRQVDTRNVGNAGNSIARKAHDRSLVVGQIHPRISQEGPASTRIVQQDLVLLVPSGPDIIFAERQTNVLIRLVPVPVPILVIGEFDGGYAMVAFQRGNDIHMIVDIAEIMIYHDRRGWPDIQ